MSKELVISSNRHETKVAILEDDQLVEIYFQRADEYSLAGSVHKGRVTRVLPGMQSAFVDLGLERDTFLYVSDFLDETEEYDPIPTGREERQGRGDRPIRTERPDRADRANRSERPDRFDRTDHGEKALVEAEPEPSPLEANAGTATHPSGQRPEASQLERPSAGGRPNHHPSSGQRPDDDHRGRRSRRRRNRGRGFPDSKYASEVNSSGSLSLPSSQEPRATESPIEQAAESLVDYEFPVLPGESLAKYRHSEHGAAADQSPAPKVDLFSTTGAAPVRETWSEPEQVQQPEEMEAPPEAIAVSEIIAEMREDAAFALEEIADAPQLAILEPSVAREIPISEPEAGEGLPDSDESADESESAPDTTPQLTAHVREQGGRYMHRLPRRMRRKMRTEGGKGQPEAPSESAASGGPAPVDSSAALPEVQRSVSRPEKTPLPSITDLLKEGQEIIVQIAKEPLGQKGARITSHIALPGRFVVYMPTLEHMGVSRKVGSDDERLRLKKILQSHSASMTGGFIVRTAGEGKPEDEIAADMTFLHNLWLDIRQKAEKHPAPLLLHHDLDIVQRILRDQLTDSFKAIWLDNEEQYESVLRFAQRFQPALVGRIKLYTRSAPIFDAFNITPELEKALRPKVWLKSGGYIVINQTEALVAIDVNTGKFVGKSNRLEDTIVKTNTEAVKEIARQIRLRDLGGIIVVDFIDMDERKNRQKVMQTLEEAMRSDKAPNKILQFNDFGLVAITRKRVKQSLERALCSPCPYCEGAGYVKSLQTTVNDILQEAHKIASAVEGKDVLLRVHPDLAKYLKSHQNHYLEEFEEILRRPVLVKADPSLHHEKFDLA
ncbi:MAG: Rne/Rng family ribonuclease [Bryobacteraceae bacterium]